MARQRKSSGRQMELQLGKVFSELNTLNTSVHKVAREMFASGNTAGARTILRDWKKTSEGVKGELTRFGKVLIGHR